MSGVAQNPATSGRGPFASALRNLAKQADIKDEDGATPVGGGGGGGGVSAGGGASGANPASGAGGNLSSDAVRGVNSGATSLMTTVQRSGTHDGRVTGDGRGSSNQTHTSDVRQSVVADDRGVKKRTSSPPPEKVSVQFASFCAPLLYIISLLSNEFCTCNLHLILMHFDLCLQMARLSSIQPDLALARSGFQPYRPDERLTHPAGAFPIEAYTSFGAIPGLPPGKNLLLLHLLLKLKRQKFSCIPFFSQLFKKKVM